LAFADGSGGVLPRDSVSAYQAHRDTDDVTVAASLLPPNRAAKLFTFDVSKRYIVVEVAVYPKPGHDVDIHLLDFELKRASGEKSLPATPEEVAAVWGQKPPQLPSRAPVMAPAQGGAQYGSAGNPNTGRPDHVWGTYAGEGPGYAPPMYGSGPGAHSLEAKVRQSALPQGRTNRAVAGYVFFPVARQRKDDVPEICYLLPGGGSIGLRLPL